MGTITVGGQSGVFLAPVGVNVTTSDAEVLAARRRRNMVVLVNDSDTDIYLATDGETAVLNRGVRINSGGGSAQYGGPGGLPLTTGAINAIHGGTGNKVLGIQESE